MSNAFQTVEPIREGHRAQNAAALAGMFPELRTHSPGETFNLVRMLNDMSLEKFHAGSSYEANVCAAAAIVQGGEHDKQRAMLPWGALARIQRDLGMTVPSAGGNLVGTATPRVVDVLRPYSLMTRLGIRILENNMQNLVVPKINTAVTGQWLATETSAITNSDPVIGVVSSKPKTAGALMKLSRQFMLQGQNANEFIAEQLMACMGEMLDRAVLAGTGLLGQPTGILNTSGVNDTTLVADPELGDWAAAISGLEDNGVSEENLRVVLPPTQKFFIQYVDERRFSTAGPAWKDGKLAGVPAFSTNRAPDGKVIFGDFTKVQVAIWGSGITIEVDPYTSFKSGGIQVRVLMHCDVQVTRPEAFSIVSES